MFSPMRLSILYLADVRFVTADLLLRARPQWATMKGVVLWITPDRLALARATNTNEAALISARAPESSANPLFSASSHYAASCARIAASDAERLRRAKAP